MIIYADNHSVENENAIDEMMIRTYDDRDYESKD
jgi:hypothetical protein